MNVRQLLTTTLLCGLLQGAAHGADTVNEYDLPHVVMTNTVYFEQTVLNHFDQVRPCWGQKRIPIRANRHKIIRGCLEGSKRFWPRDSEMPIKLFGAIISEGGGNNDGAPNDPFPGYGVCNMNIHSAKWAAAWWNIPVPKTDKQLELKLKTDIEFNVFMLAAQLAALEDRFGGDWISCVLRFKYGRGGYEKLLVTLAIKKLPRTEAKVWKHYRNVLIWLSCTHDRVFVTAPVDCGCMPPNVSADSISNLTNRNNE